MKKVLMSLFRKGVYLINQEYDSLYIKYLTITKKGIYITVSFGSFGYTAKNLKWSRISRKTKRKLSSYMIDTFIMHKL